MNDDDTTDVSARERWIRRLRRVLQDMPDDLWFWAADGKLYLMEKTPGEQHRAIGPRVGARVDPSAEVADFDVDTDGGDW